MILRLGEAARVGDGAKKIEGNVKLAQGYVRSEVGPEVSRNECDPLHQFIHVHFSSGAFGKYSRDGPMEFARFSGLGTC